MKPVKGPSLRAYRKGQDAQKRGDSRDENPYKKVPGNPRKAALWASWWDAGWCHPDEDPSEKFFNDPIPF